MTNILVIMYLGGGMLNSSICAEWIAQPVFFKRPQLLVMRIAPYRGVPTLW